MNPVSSNNNTIPIAFIVGCPRSGKTLLQSMMAFHESFAWFSQYTNSLVWLPAIGWLHRIYDLPILGEFCLRHRDGRIFPEPAELPKRINQVLQRYGSLNSTDVTSYDRISLRRMVSQQIRYQRRDRFITDEGRPARLAYFEDIFPQSSFIHVIRDGRNVVNEFLTRRLAWFQRGKTPNHFYKTVPMDYIEIWNQYRGTNDETLVLAALRWGMAIREIERQSEHIKAERFTVIRYEDLVNNAKLTVDRLLVFLGLKWTKRLESVIFNKRMMINSNSRLTARQKELIENILKPILLKYNYLC